MSFCAFVCACAPAPSPESGTRDVDAAALDPLAWVTRVSLDVRGVRPSRQDVEDVSADPTAADALVERYLADPRVGTRVAWLWNDALHVAVYFRDPPYRRLSGTPEQLRAVGWQDLEVVRAIVDEDRPFSDVVTAQELPESDLTAGFWGIDGPGSGVDWTWRTPTDGRPMAGLLSSSTFWLAHDDDRQNLHRQRANVIAGVFTCADFFEREVDLELVSGIGSAADLEDAARSDPGCVSCHAALDPLAAAVGGFADRGTVQAQPDAWPYSPYMADWFRGWNAPAWWGTPVADLRDLGTAIAADPRFPRCVVRRTAEALFGEEVSEAALDDWTPGFVDEDGLRLRALLGRLVRSDAYRTLEPRVLTTEQLSTTLFDLTGTVDDGDPDAGFAPLAWRGGLRTLGGGTDDTFVLERTREAGAGVVLVQQWAARQARASLQADAARASGARALWTHAQPGVPPSDEVLRHQLVDWYTRGLSVPAASDDAAIDGLVDVWHASGGAEDPDGAFGACLEAIVRHPAVVVTP